MIVYFNEAFLLEQYEDVENQHLDDALKKISEFSEILNLKRNEYSAKIYFKTGRNQVKDFAELFSENNDQTMMFLESLNKLGVKFWNCKQVQDNQFNYYLINVNDTPPSLIDVESTSLAEAAELKRRSDEKVMTLNLPDLKFSQSHNFGINIVHKINQEDTDHRIIECASSKDSLAVWIDNKLNEEYIYTDYSRPPLDKETCLRNQTVFRKIVKKFQGRDIYKDKQGQFWHVDNLHDNRSAHIEVYNRLKNHIGEASLDGEIDLSKADNNKKLDI